MFLNEQKVIQMDGLPIAYPAYAMLGTMLWQNFADALQAPLQMAAQNRSMLVRVQFPREALILAGIYQVIFNIIIRLLLLIPDGAIFQNPGFIQHNAGTHWDLITYSTWNCNRFATYPIGYFVQRYRSRNVDGARISGCY